MRVETSIIIPVFNAAKHLRACLASIQQQSKPDFEVILVDDGSTDNSSDILAEFTQADSRFSVVQQMNAGAAAARNQGLDRACGNTIALVDADDVLMPTYLEQLTSAIHQADIAICGYSHWHDGVQRPIIIQPSGPMEREQLIRHSLATTGLTGGCWNKLLRRALIEENQLRFDPAIHVGEDMLFLMGYYQAVRQAAYVAEPLYLYRQHESSITHVSEAAQQFSARDASVLDAVEQLCDITQAESAVIQDVVAYRQVRSSLRLFRLIQRCNYADTTLIERVQTNIKTGLKGFTRSGHASFSESMGATLVAKSPALTGYLIRHLPKRMMT
jgi:glycosyltransferase involved in cell wall biosynthesis